MSLLLGPGGVSVALVVYLLGVDNGTEAVPSHPHHVNQTVMTSQTGLTGPHRARSCCLHPKTRHFFSAVLFTIRDCRARASNKRGLDCLCSHARMTGVGGTSLIWAGRKRVQVRCFCKEDSSCSVALRLAYR